MTLIKCPECSTEISDEAAACVKCGYPLDGSIPADPSPSRDEQGGVRVDDSGGDAPSSAQESASVLLDEPGVLVTLQKLKVAEGTYRIQNIQKATKRKFVDEPNTGSLFMLIMFGAALVSFGLPSLFTGRIPFTLIREEFVFEVSRWASLLMLVAGGFMALVGIRGWRKRGKIEIHYWVTLSLSSGESVGVDMQGSAQANRVLDALNQAMDMN